MDDQHNVVRALVKRERPGAENSHMPGSVPAPGWYPDPENPSGERWWDGSQWGPRLAAERAEPYRPQAPALESSDMMSGPRVFGLPWRIPLAMFAGVGLLVSYVFGIQDKPVFSLDWGPEPIAAPPAVTAVGAGCVERWNTSHALSAYRKMLATRGSVKFSVKTFGVDGPGTEFPRGTCGVAVADGTFQTLAVFAAVPGGDYVDITRSSWTQMVPLQHPSDVNAAMHPDGRLESVTPVSA